jgi:hypothetical protein
MRIIPLAFTTLCVVLLTSVAFAKYNKAAQPMDSQAMMDLYTKLAAPGKPHKLFATLAGSWTSKTKE